MKKLRIPIADLANIRDDVRISVDEYYLNIANAVSAGSTCIIRHYGAVLVKDERIISTGYNGSCRGLPNCCDIGICSRKLDTSGQVPHGRCYESCVSVHAEQNALLSANRSDLKGSTLYLFGKNHDTGCAFKPDPCFMCEKLLIAAGVESVVTWAL